MKWFKMHHGRLTDLRWPGIAAAVKAKPIEVAGLYFAIYDYASRQPDRGSVAGFSLADLAIFLGLKLEKADAIVRAFRERGIIVADRLGEWEVDQEAPAKDLSTPRVRRHRERKRAAEASENVVEFQSRNATETGRNAAETVKRHETRQIQTVEEEEASPPTAPLAGEQGAGAPSGRNRAIRWPEYAIVPPEWRKEAATIIADAGLPAIDIDLTADGFSDFWRAKPGKGGAKLDWRATWRNWVREEARRQRRQLPARVGTPSVDTAGKAALAYLERRQARGGAP